MERITQSIIVFTVCILIGLLSIIIANGELTWTTASLALAVMLIGSFVAGVWTIVRGHFSTSVEIGLTVAIVTLAVIFTGLMTIAGTDIRDALGDTFNDGSAWWPAAPLIGALYLSVLSKRVR